MVVCSKEANRLPKQYYVSLCFLFVHLLSFLPVFVSSSVSVFTTPVSLNTCLPGPVSLSLLCMDTFWLSIFFSFHDAIALKKGISPPRICLPLSPLLQKHSGRGRVSIFPQPRYLCVCLYLCLILHSNSSLSLHRENWGCRLFGYRTTSWSKSSIFYFNMHLYFSSQIAKETPAPSVIFLWSQSRSAHRFPRCCGDSGTSAVIVYIA